MQLIDSHVHFPSPDYRKRITGMVDPWVVKERERWRRAWGFEPPEICDDFDELIEKWYQETVRCEMQVIFVTSGGNDSMEKIVRSHPGRFFGYAHHHPMDEDAPEILEKAITQQGLSGYKIVAPKVDRPLEDPSFNPIWEVAQHYRIPVLVHFGIVGSAGGIAHHININPLVIHDVAKRFPQMAIIVPHFGCGYLFELLNLCWACPNVFVDSCGSNQWTRWMPYEVNLEMLFRKFRETIGAGRVIFGTDSSYFPRGFAQAYLDNQFRAMCDVGFTEDEIEQVLYRNILSLLPSKVEQV